MLEVITQKGIRSTGTQLVPTATPVDPFENRAGRFRMEAMPGALEAAGIKPGTVLVLDECVEPIRGDLVLARHKVTGEKFFGRYVPNWRGGYLIKDMTAGYADSSDSDAEVYAVMIAQMSGRLGCFSC